MGRHGARHLCLGARLPAGLAPPAALAVAALALAGCSGQASTAVPLLGAYFPSWLICATFGVLGAVAVRALFVRAGIDAVLPFRLPVYACLAAALGFVLALTVYGR